MKRPRKQKLETKYVLEVKESLEKVPCVSEVWRNQTGCVQVKRGWMHLAPEGTPDLTGHLDDGIALHVEVKTPEGETSPEQDKFILAAQKRGCCAFVARSGAEAIRLVLAFRRGEQLPSPVASVETARARRKARALFQPPLLQKELAL